MESFLADFLHVKHLLFSSLCADSFSKKCPQQTAEESPNNCALEPVRLVHHNEAKVIKYNHL